MKTILIVDDESDYFDILSITKENYNFCWVSSLKEMNNKIQNEKIDLILLDWDLVGEKGTDCLSSIKSEYTTSKIPVIMLTGRNKSSDLVFALTKGADDYISKPVEVTVLMAKIEANLRKYHLSNISKNIYISGVHFDENSLSVKTNNKTVNLRKKEFEILKTLASNPDKVYSREELNCICAGEKIFVSPRSIDTFVTYIRNKFKGVDLIKTVPRKGYKFNVNFNQNKKGLSHE